MKGTQVSWGRAVSFPVTGCPGSTPHSESPSFASSKKWLYSIEEEGALCKV